jgi:hypothetical protein
MASGTFRLAFPDLVLPASGLRVIIWVKLDTPLPVATLPAGFAVGCLALFPLVARLRKMRVPLGHVLAGASVCSLSTSVARYSHWRPAVRSRAFLSTVIR